ncbi:hypothetical protein NDU88_000382 [Pleurodeles waltl]|uniref:Uncharacterized protein n=1 Tax=Pleurodeles waltl TaxID=8319 RepID=A0AAV7UPT4_PLEWA|nr:hypothetical protein NDU88_000382 [Pleurodeles waltl]
MPCWWCSWRSRGAPRPGSASDLAQALRIHQSQGCHESQDAPVCGCSKLRQDPLAPLNSCGGRKKATFNCCYCVAGKSRPPADLVPFVSVRELLVARKMAATSRVTGPTAGGAMMAP